MRNWVDAIVSMSGFPVPAMQHAADASLRLLEWQYQGNGQPLTERLAVDETHLYQGLAMLAAKPPELARIYILLARHGTLAWKDSLSLLSACPPGTPEEMIAANDHVRARATFGDLRFL